MHPTTPLSPSLPPSSSQGTTDLSSSSAPSASSEGWRGESQPPPPSFTPTYVRRFQSQFQQLLASKQPDPLGPILANLTSSETRTEVETQQLRGLYASLRLFADLIPQEHREDIIQDEQLSIHHKGLTPLRALRKQLLKFRTSATTPSICKHLEDLSGYYNECLRTFILGSSEERRKLLASMVQVWHDGFFVIPLKLARELTSCDELGRTVQQNRYGSRPVVQRNGLFLKVGAPEGATLPDPASEYAVSSLCQLVSPSKMIAVPSGMFYVRGSESCAGGLVQASLAVGDPADRPTAIPLIELLDVINSFDLFKSRCGSTKEPEKKWKAFLEWATKEPAKGIYKEDVLKQYLEWMKKCPSKKRCTEFMNPEDLPEGEEQRSFFARGDAWDYQLRAYQAYLASYPPPVWDKLLTLLKAHPTLMQGQSLCTLLRLSRAFEWIQKLFPGASLEEVSLEISQFLDKIDRDALSRLFLASLITNPNDGKDDNYVVRIKWNGKQIADNGFVIVGVDNDLAFKHPILKGARSHHLRTKCLLYALRKKMLRERIPSEVRTFFQNQTGDDLFLQWIVQLDRQNQVFLRAEKAAGCASKLALGFPKRALTRVLKHLRKVCSLLEHKDVSLNSVFKAVEPVVYHCYDEAREQTRNANDALRRLDFKRGVSLEELLKERFASVELDGQRVSLHKAIQMMGADDHEEFDTGGEQKKDSLSQAAQSAVKELIFSSVSRSLPHLKLLSKLSFAEELQLPLTQPQAQKLLKIAITLMDSDLARLSLVNGASPPPKTGSHPIAKVLLKAKSNPKRAEQLLRVLLEHGADPNHKNRAGRPLLLCLIPTIEGNTKLGERLLKTLVEHEADLEWKHPRTHSTFLDWAIQHERPLTFVVLVRQGAGRSVDAAAALRFARHTKHRRVEGMSDALKLLEQRCPEIGWIQDLEAIKVKKPRKGSFEVEGASTGKTLLHPSVVQQLGITAKGKFPEKPRVQYGRHCVRPIVIGGRMLMAKDSPELAGNEYLACATHSIIGHGVPKTDLFKYRNVLGVSTPLQLAQLIDGEDFREVFYSAKGLERLKQLDTELLHDLILLKIATRPGDDKTENFILRGKELICIDNDRAWMPSHLVVCVLFCLDQMNDQRVHPRTRKRFLALDPERTIRDWLERCLTQNERYAQLFDHEERKKQYNRDPKEPGIIQMVLPHKTAPRFYQALCRIQDALEEPGIKPLDVLLHAEPEIGRRYEKLFKKKSHTARDRWKVIRNAHYPMVCKAGGRLTRTTTLDMFQHYHIDPKVVLKKEPSHFLKSELNQLKRAYEEDKETELALQELYQGKTDRFKGFLLDVHREKTLKRYEFGKGGGRWKLAGVSSAYSDDIVINAILNSQTSFRHFSIAGLDITALHEPLRSLVDSDYVRYQKKHGIVATEFNYKVIPILTMSPALKTLNLSSVFFPQTALKTISNRCRYLRELRLNNCQELKNIWNPVGWLTFPSLRRLKMKQCENLERFNLRAHRLQFLDLSGCKELTRFALDIPNAKTVWLHDCRALKFDDLQTIAAALPNAQLSGSSDSLHAQFRDVIGSPASSEGKVFFASCLQLIKYPPSALGKPMLDPIRQVTEGLASKLVLTRFDLEPLSWEALSVALKHSQSITCVEVSSQRRRENPTELPPPPARDNSSNPSNFTKATAQLLSDAINFNTRITKLKLHCYGFWDEWSQFLRQLKGNMRLTSFVFRGKNEKPCAKAIEEGVLGNSSLTSLTLSSSGLATLAKRRTRYHAYMDLRDAICRTTYVQKIGQMTRLTHLNLSCNCLKNMAIREILTSISILSLCSLNVAKNQMGDKGLQSMAQFMSKNRTLRKLDISGNGPFLPQKLAEFGKSLAENYTLSDLSIWSCLQNDEDSGSFLKSIQKNQTLTALDLPDVLTGGSQTGKSSVSPGIIQRFREFLRRNRQLRSASPIVGFVRRRNPPRALTPRERIICRDTAWAMVIGCLTKRLGDPPGIELTDIVVNWAFPRLRHRPVNGPRVEAILARRFPSIDHDEDEDQ